MARKKYKWVRVESDTNKNFNMKTKKLNEACKKLGLKNKIYKIDLMKIMSERPIYLDDIELIKLAKKKKI